MLILFITSFDLCSWTATLKHLPHNWWIDRRTDVLWFSMSQWVRSEKITFLVETIKHKALLLLFCVLASLLPARARPISDMKSQPGLFVSSIPGSSATTTCIAKKRIASPDTLWEPFKPSDQTIHITRRSIPEVKCCPKVVHIGWSTSLKQAN